MRNPVTIIEDTARKILCIFLPPMTEPVLVAPVFTLLAWLVFQYIGVRT